MNIDINGLRRNLTYDLNKLFRKINSMAHYMEPSGDELSELKDCYNEIAKSVFVLNLCYTENDPSFADLSEKLTILRFEEEVENETN